MNKHASYLVASILVTTVTPALAESQWAPQEVRDAAWRLTENKTRIGTRPFEGELKRDAEGVTACQASIERARDRGATKLYDDTFKPYGATKNGPYWELTLGQAEGICREAVFYKEVVMKDVATFANMSTDYDRKVEHDDSLSAHESSKKFVDACQPALDAMLAAGVDPTLPFVLNEKVKTVGDLKAHCAAGREVYQKYLEYLKQKEAKDRAPYLKAGMKGERLEFVMQYDGYIYLPGGETTDNLKKLATAPALFIWNTSDPDASDYVVHTVRKHVFKGNVLVKTYEKTYRKPRGAKLGGGVFK